MQERNEVIPIYQHIISSPHTQHPHIRQGIQQCSHTNQVITQAQHILAIQFPHPQSITITQLLRLNRFVLMMLQIQFMELLQEQDGLSLVKVYLRGRVPY